MRSGNITAKTSTTDPAENVGTYTYHATKKHAVASTSNGWSFGYDGNGNMNSYKGNTISWYSYNLPNVINGAGQSSQFFYGPNRNRWKQVASYASGTETTIYVGGILEKLTTPSGTAYRHYLGAGSAKVLYTRWSTGQISTKYVTSDHLNSSTVVMDSAGAALVNLSFATYGARRDADWSGPVTSGDMTQISNATRRGFTSHEHLDNMNLVHMNGRVFEPTLGRFLSADPFMPGSLGTQAQNRYAYVGNRSLSLVDPSGYFARNGAAVRQWMNGPGALDALELAINRGWLMWGGVRNVSDGLEGTHVGLLSHSLQMFGMGNYSPTVLSIVANSGSVGRQMVGNLFASAAAASRAIGGGGANLAGSSSSCADCLPEVTVTATRSGGQETISWSPGQIAPNAPRLGGTGHLIASILNHVVPAAHAESIYGDPNGEPFVPWSLLPAEARYVLANRRLDEESGQVILDLPGYSLEPNRRMGVGWLLVPPEGGRGPSPASNVVRIMPSSFSSSYPNGYYVVYNSVGRIISPYSGRDLGMNRSLWHNPIGAMAPIGGL